MRNRGEDGGTRKKREIELRYDVSGALELGDTLPVPDS